MISKREEMRSAVRTFTIALAILRSFKECRWSFEDTGKWGV
jgi:hypothetical protein